MEQPKTPDILRAKQRRDRTIGGDKRREPHTGGCHLILYKMEPPDTLDYLKDLNHIMLRSCGRSICCLLAAGVLLAVGPRPIHAEHVIELPILAAIKSNKFGVFEILLLQWDQKPAPAPPSLQWRSGNVVLGDAHLGSMAEAFRYAMARTPSVQHSGTVTALGFAYRPTGSDGPSAGAAMAVGFIALFKGDPLSRGVALTGTLQSDGSIGPVGSIPDKVRAAAREGYRTVLIPSGQLNAPDWGLIRLGMELNVDLKEVGTIEEAYRLMTGRSL
ncbi:MAG: S16 family serine protease [Nitrospiraceae bacterium]